VSTRGVWWRVAWRNLWRNRGRTLVTAAGLAFGYLSAVVMVGLTDGMSAELIDNGTRLMVGQLQIHAPDYLPERGMHATIGGDGGTDLARLMATIEGDPDVVSAAPRLYGGGLVSSGDQTLAGLLLGVDPGREARVTTLLSTLDGGRVPTPDAHEVLLGREMARQLGLELGDEVVLVAPAADGSMGNDLYTLVGTFETGSAGIDGGYAILALSDLQLLMAMEPTRIHEVALDVTRPWDSPAIATEVAERLRADGFDLQLRPWTELRPELAESVALMDSLNFIIVIIIFAMAVFGVANVMLIGTFERVREFSVVRALGTTAAGVGQTVVYEGVILGAMALVVGALMTAPIMIWWHNAPPDLSWLVGGFNWSGAMWRPVLRVEYSLDAPLFSAFALFVTAIVAAVYPAWKVTRIPPADALAGR
jgi:ABC-type lipoprotein release transport system permease subunit